MSDLEMKETYPNIPFMLKFKVFWNVLTYLIHHHIKFETLLAKDIEPHLLT